MILYFCDIYDDIDLIGHCFISFHSSFTDFIYCLNGKYVKVELIDYELFYYYNDIDYNYNNFYISVVFCL